MASIGSKGSSLQRGFTYLKNKAINLARGRTSLALLGLLLFVYSVGIFTSSPPQEEEILLTQSKDLPFETLKDVAAYLRANDTRLVRPGPSDKTWKRQDSDACGLYLEQAYQMLAKPLGARAESVLRDAANVITLCTTDRPKHRAKLTTVVQGVPTAIVSLVSSSTSYSSMAAAAECIWISSFSSRENHEAFVDAGAVDSLSRVLTEHDCDSLAAKQAAQGCYLAQMWAAAALQNLAAAYCDTKNWGGCDWEGTDTTTTDGRHEIAIDKDTPVQFNPEPIRLSMIRNTKLLKTLEKIICDNVKELDKAPSERTWPSRAKVTEVELSPSVATWGAIGAVRNLALSPEFYAKMPLDLQNCLCAHAVRSPDWLESSKAKDAIYRFGFERSDVCEPLYDPKKCFDFKDWKDNEGGNCRKYEKERWCADTVTTSPIKKSGLVTSILRRERHAVHVEEERKLNDRVNLSLRVWRLGHQCQLSNKRN